MKKLILVLLFGIVLNTAYSQYRSLDLSHYDSRDLEYGYRDTIPYEDYLIISEHEEVNIAECEERGHVRGGVYMTTDLFCPSYLIDSLDISYIVYPSCNWITYTCLRCGQQVTEKEPERKEVVWNGNFITEQKTINLVERETTLIFKHKISAKWMQRRFKRVHLTRNIETDCLTYKCEYHIKIKPGDEFLFMPDNKRLVIPCRIQLKLK